MNDKSLVKIPDLTLTKLGYPEIDKICNADFVKKNFKSTATKKDFSFFVHENKDFSKFLESLEENFAEKKDEYREMIKEYLESISDDVLKFLNQLKEKKRLKKIQEKEMAEKMLEDRVRAKILKEMENEKKKKELEEKMDVSSEEKDEKNDLEENDDVEIISGKKEKENKTTEDRTNKQDLPLKFKKSENNRLVENKDKNEEKDEKISLSLSEIFKALRKVQEADLLVIKSDDGRLNIRYIDLEDNKIQIKVE